MSVGFVFTVGSPVGPFDLAGIIDNRSIVWWTTTSQDACPGFKDHLIKLPNECFNREKVILRMQVADKVTDKAPATSASTYLDALGIEQGTLTNNGTKGNPCLIADIFGDFREELLLRTEDSSAIRIYMNTEISSHKLFTLLHDIQYRVGIAWQNNCYNQPCYPKFYYAGDMDWAGVLPALYAGEEKQRD